jgi:hypothetical protein
MIRMNFHVLVTKDRKKEDTIPLEAQAWISMEKCTYGVSE